MPPRKKPIDPVATLEVEVCASLGESYLKATCSLNRSAELLARMHKELEAACKLRPSISPRADGVPAGTIYVPDESDYEQGKRLGFG